ncbi:uncharacterized protein [Littorina saxatilis]|uniref:uncharacterized protein n=1 Tax=Littorina saxatilis TaxID=31220 RepID=UPI0038B4302C
MDPPNIKSGGPGTLWDGCPWGALLPSSDTPKRSQLQPGDMAGCDRRETFQQAVRDCQWQAVRQLVQQGSSLEQRDLAVSQAVSHSQWGLVSQLVQLGISQKCRDVAVHKAVRYCLWNIVDELVAAGVSTEKRDFVLQRGLRQREWVLVSRLLTLGVGLELRDLVVTTALEHGQWELVLDGLRLGVKHKLMTKAFQEVVSQKRWEHVPGLVTLCKNSYHTDFQDLIDLLKEDGIEPRVRDVILSTAQRHDHWDEYLTILKETGTTEKEIADVITTALYSINVCVILRLFSIFVSARRVFKHVLLRTRFSDHDIIVLHTFLMDDHPDLSFYMFTAQQMWESVVGIFGDARLGTKDRRFAIRHAIKKCAWFFVDAMACSPSTSHRDRRYVFLQAARQGQWLLALKLSTYSKSVSVRDKLLALRTWFQLGLWGCLQDVLNHWVQPFRRGIFPVNWEYQQKQKLVKCILKESIIAEQIAAFRDICSNLHLDAEFSRFIFQTAIKHDKYHFVLEFCCHRMNAADIADVQIALELAIKNKRWNLLKDLITRTLAKMRYVQGQFCLYVLRLFISRVSLDKQAWEVVVPSLDELCRALSSSYALNWDFDEIPVTPKSMGKVQRLCEWCLSSALRNAALVLSVVSGNEVISRRVAEQHEYADIRSGVISFCFVVALQRSEWETAFTFLQRLQVDDVENIVDDLQEDINFSNLMEKCRENISYKWPVYIGVWTAQWEQVEDDVRLCEDTSVIDFAIDEASTCDKWDIVQSQLPRCSQDSDLLCEVLKRAVRSGQAEISTALLSKVDLEQADFSIQSFLHTAVTSAGDREDMVKLCVKFGLSTHVRPCNCASTNNYCFCSSSPMRTALRNGQMPLVKVLYKAGACSNKHLFLCKQDTDLRTRLQGQGRHDIVEYLDHVTTTPRTLQDLCRLQVSHHIGCRPGRLDRVMTLDISWPTKDLINFEDVPS